VEYYAQGTPFNPSDLCRGEVTEIFPSEGLSIITDIHLLINGLYPITYGRPIRLNREGEWINADNCECIVDRQDDGVRRQSGIFKAVVDNATEDFYTKESKPLEDSDDSASPSEEESNDGAAVSCSVGEDVVAQTDFGGVFRPCGYKQDGKWEAISQSRKKEERSGGRQTKMIQRMSLRTLFRRIEPRNPIPFQTINQQGILFPM